MRELTVTEAYDMDGRIGTPGHEHEVLIELDGRYYDATACTTEQLLQLMHDQQQGRMDAQTEPFEIIDAFYTDDSVIDRWTTVFNEVNPYNGYHTMLATDDTGFGFSQWAEGTYSPDGSNEHLGNQVCLLAGSVLLRHVMQRMHEGDVL